MEMKNSIRNLEEDQEAVKASFDELMKTDRN